MTSFFNSLMAPLICNLVPRGEHHEESRGYMEEPRHEFSFYLIPPMIFNLVPRGEHHEESRGPKEEPCQDFFFNSLTPPLIFNLVPRGEHHEESRGDKEEPRHKQMPILMFICNLGQIKVNKIITKYNLHNFESPAWHINILHTLRYI